VRTALAQRRGNQPVSDRIAKTTKLFKSPEGFPNGVAVTPEVWMGANAPPQGIFQVDMSSKLVSHRQIPLGSANDGGG
jgi:hypothetical protein